MSKKERLLAVLASVLLTFSVHVHAATTIAKGVYLIPGAATGQSQPDGNSVIFEAPQGLIVFDTGRHTEHTQKIIDFASQAHRPIRAIINSHWHLDHVGGNVLLRARYPDVHIYASSAMQEAQTTFLAHYRQQLEAAIAAPDGSQGPLASLRAELALVDAGPALLPTDVIGASGSRTIAGRRLELNLEHDAVTAGDVWIEDSRSGLLLAGDLVTLPAPFLDTACPTRWQESLARVSGHHFGLLVPGHGPPLHREEFETYRTAFEHLLACGRSDRPKSDCIDGWLHDGDKLIAATDQAYARALLDYYVEQVLRGDPARVARLCAA